MCRHTVHRGAGWWRGPGLLVPGWPHPVSLTHISSHLCSPQVPVTSPLCVSQVAQQVSRSTQVTSQGHRHPSLAALSGDCRSLWCPREWAEPCAMPGSRCWVPPATPSAFSHTGPAQGSTGWLDADGQVWTGRSRVGLATSRSWSQRRLCCWVMSFLYEKQLLPVTSWSLCQGLQKECGGWCLRATSRGAISQSCNPLPPLFLVSHLC